MAYDISQPFKIKDKKIFVFDIETNGLYQEVNTLHCVAIKPYDEDKEVPPTLYYGETIPDALNELSNADYLVAHNGVSYDIPVLNKLYPDLKLPLCLDTLLLTKLYNPFLKSYSLQNLGMLLKEHKGDYTGGWEFYNDEMGEYCQQDVVVTTKLFNMLIKRIDIESAPYFILEHEVARVQSKGERFGVGFDYEGAMKLSMKIGHEMDDIKEDVEPALGYAFIPHHNSKGEVQTYNLTKVGGRSANAIKWLAQSPNHVQGGEFCKVSYDKITLDTKKLLISKLLEIGWQPTMYTEKGTPQIAVKGEVCPNLESLGNFSQVGKYFVLKHRKSLVDGFFKLVRADGRIESQADTLGAVTHRYTHRGIANFPAVRSLYGEEIRSLFGAFDKGRSLVGSDLAGLELHMLAHYMNDEEYTDEVLNGDIHSKNQEAASLPTRDSAKTFIYGFLYGAGDEKVGQLVNGGREEGVQVKRQFLDSLPSLRTLIEQKQKESKKGYVTSLDGRPIRITKSEGYDGKPKYDTHKALNSLLQSSGAIFAKHWLVFTNQYLEEQNIAATIVIGYHDELQIDADASAVEEVKKALRYGVEMSDKVLKTKCPNDIDIKVGKNWKDTH